MVRDRVCVAPQMSQFDGEACREFMAEEDEERTCTDLSSSNGNPRNSTLKRTRIGKMVGTTKHSFTNCFFFSFDLVLLA